MNTREEQLKAFSRLLDIMDELREKCPWDKKQTMATLRPLTIEEVYELADAIDEENNDEIKKEVGDILLHLVFYAKIGSEKGDFNIADVIDSLCEKLIFRHPHIYGNEKVEDEEQVKKNWEKLKLKEGNTSVLGGVPKNLPALIKAIRIQEKVKGVGFDWDDKQDVWNKVQEEIAEFQVEEQKNDQEKMEQEFGDILFSLVNYARFVGINPEVALEKTNKKFIHRFQKLEECVALDGKKIQDMTLLDLDKYWEKVKK